MRWRTVNVGAAFASSQASSAASKAATSASGSDAPTPRQARIRPGQSAPCQAGLMRSTSASLALAIGSARGSQLKCVVTSTPPGRSTRRTSASVRSTSKYIQHWLATTASKLASAKGTASAAATTKSTARPSARALSRAAAIWPGATSMPLTTAPRRASSLATSPVPVPRSSRRWPLPPTPSAASRSYRRAGGPGRWLA
jgi:hypothetical protein